MTPRKVSRARACCRNLSLVFRFHDFPERKRCSGRRVLFEFVMSFFDERVVRREVAEQTGGIASYLEHQVNADAEVRSVHQSDTAIVDQLPRVVEPVIPTSSA